MSLKKIAASMHQARQAQLRRLLGENGYSAYQRRLAMMRWNDKSGM